MVNQDLFNFMMQEFNVILLESDELEIKRIIKNNTMEKETQFRIESIEELKEVHNHFKDKWKNGWNIENEAYWFEVIAAFEYITCDESGGIFLNSKHPSYKVVKNPLKKETEHFGQTVFPDDRTGIDKALQDLQNEADKLGFDVEIIFNPKK